MGRLRIMVPRLLSMFLRLVLVGCVLLSASAARPLLRTARGGVSTGSTNTTMIAMSAFDQLDAHLPVVGSSVLGLLLSVSLGIACVKVVGRGAGLMPRRPRGGGGARGRSRGRGGRRTTGGLETNLAAVAVNAAAEEAPAAPKARELHVRLHAADVPLLDAILFEYRSKSGNAKVGVNELFAFLLHWAASKLIEDADDCETDETSRIQRQLRDVRTYMELWKKRGEQVTALQGASRSALRARWNKLNTLHSTDRGDFLDDHAGTAAQRRYLLAREVSYLAARDEPPELLGDGVVQSAEALGRVLAEAPAVVATAHARSKFRRGLMKRTQAELIERFNNFDSAPGSAHLEQSLKLDPKATQRKRQPADSYHPKKLVVSEWGSLVELCDRFQMHHRLGCHGALRMVEVHRQGRKPRVVVQCSRKDCPHMPYRTGHHSVPLSDDLVLKSKGGKDVKMARSLVTLTSMFLTGGVLGSQLQKSLNELGLRISDRALKLITRETFQVVEKVCEADLELVRKGFVDLWRAHVHTSARSRCVYDRRHATAEDGVVYQIDTRFNSRRKASHATSELLLAGTTAEGKKQPSEIASIKTMKSSASAAPQSLEKPLAHVGPCCARALESSLTWRFDRPMRRKKNFEETDTCGVKVKATAHDQCGGVGEVISEHCDEEQLDCFHKGKALRTAITEEFALKVRTTSEAFVLCSQLNGRQCDSIIAALGLHLRREEKELWLDLFHTAAPKAPTVVERRGVLNQLVLNLSMRDIEVTLKHEGDGGADAAAAAAASVEGDGEDDEMEMESESAVTSFAAVWQGFSSIWRRGNDKPAPAPASAAAAGPVSAPAASAPSKPWWVDSSEDDDLCDEDDAPGESPAAQDDEAEEGGNLIVDLTESSGSKAFLKRFDEITHTAMLLWQPIVVGDVPAEVFVWPECLECPGFTTHLTVDGWQLLKAENDRNVRDAVIGLVDGLGARGQTIAFAIKDKVPQRWLDDEDCHIVTLTEERWGELCDVLEDKENKGKTSTATGSILRKSNAAKLASHAEGSVRKVLKHDVLANLQWSSARGCVGFAQKMSTHFYHTTERCSKEERDGAFIVKSMRNFFRGHMRGDHRNCDESCPKHGTVDPRGFEKERDYLEQLETIEKIVMSRLTESVANKLTKNLYTSEVESFHRTLQYFCPKLVEFHETTHPRILCAGADSNVNHISEYCIAAKIEGATHAEVREYRRKWRTRVLDELHKRVAVVPPSL